MTKRDDDNPRTGEHYTLGDILGAALIGGAIAGLGVASMLLRAPPAPRREPEGAREPDPPFEVEDRASGAHDDDRDDDGTGGVPHVGCN